MSGALNGTIRADGHNPYRAIEVHRMPAGEQEAFAAVFEERIAEPLGLRVGGPGHIEAWTVGRTIWLAAWEREMRLRAEAKRAAMDAEVVSLDQGFVIAEVDGGVPDKMARLPVARRAG